MFFASTFNGWIAGDMIIGQNLNLSATGSLDIGRHLYVGQVLTFGNRITDVKIGGTLFASGKIDFQNSVNKINVAGDFISNGDLEFDIQILDFFQVTGIMAVRGNVTFSNHVPTATDVNRFGGFYIGGSMTMPTWVNPNRDPIFCIAHNPPPVGGDESTIDFGNWTGN